MAKATIDDLEELKIKELSQNIVSGYPECRRVSTSIDSKYRSYDIFFRDDNETRSSRQATSAGNDDEAEEEEEAVADKRTSNVAAGQSELWDN